MTSTWTLALLTRVMSASLSLIRSNTFTWKSNPESLTYLSRHLNSGLYPSEVSCGSLGIRAKIAFVMGPAGGVP